jgi:hypothetical protein
MRKDGGVFISYRRDDTAGHAGRLFDTLVRRFGEPPFLDLTDIAPGSISWRRSSGQWILRRAPRSSGETG